MRWIADLFIFSSIYDLNLKNKLCLNMNEIKDSIVCSLPNISKKILQKLITITTIQKLGVNEESNLVFVEKDDINTNVRPIEAWKLIKAWNSGKPNHYNVFLKYISKLLFLH